MRYFQIPGTYALIDERLTPSQVHRIEQSFKDFRASHPSDSFGLAFDFRHHYHGKPEYGWDVTAMVISSDYCAQINLDIYGNGAEWWFRVDFTPIHGDHEDFEDEICNKKEVEDEKGSDRIEVRKNDQVLV